MSEHHVREPGEDAAASEARAPEDPGQRDHYPGRTRLVMVHCEVY